MRLRIDHEITVRVIEGDPSQVDLLNKIFNQNKTIMVTLAQFQTALTRIDTATTAIAQQLRDLRDQIAGGGLSAEVEAQVLTQLETSATQLEAVGQSVENPVPPIPPVEG